MTQNEVKEKLDEILSSTFSQNTFDSSLLDEKDYNLIIDTVWQQSIGIYETEYIRSKELDEKLKGNNRNELYRAQILERLMKECKTFSKTIKNEI